MATVLLVEDEDQVRLLAESYLEEQGHKVLSAGTPEGALAVLQNETRVDILFTDLDLKGDVHAGINLANEAIKILPQLRVLYTTGRAITDGMKARFVAGSAVLEKPYTVDQLRMSLSKHFDINPLLRSKQS
jgi:DNA-binding NtrC family response regulator